MAAVGWHVRRRPAGRLVAFSILLAIGFAAGSTALLMMLSAEPSLPLCGSLGLVIGSLLLAPVLRGTQARIEGGLLVYGQEGRDTCTIPVPAIRGLRWIATGALEGIGLDVEPQQVRVLNRKGVRPVQMQAWRRDLGVGLVLEGLAEIDVPGLAQALADAGSPLQKTPSPTTCATPTGSEP